MDPQRRAALLLFFTAEYAVAGHSRPTLNISDTSMAFLSGDVRRANSVFLLILVPILIRLWYEAVVWRIEQGPQMLGFQVAHMAAGGLLAPVLAPLLLASLLAVYAYLAWTAVVVVLRFVPKLRRGLTNVHFGAAGAFSLLLFNLIADRLQRGDLSNVVLFGGALLLTMIALVPMWLIYIGFQRKSNAATDV